MLEDVPRLRCPLRLRSMERGDGQVWPYYTFDGFEGRAAHAGSVVPAACQAVGYGLNWGDCVTLSQVVALARRLWGWHWVRRFRDRMSSLGNHLAVVEELWWLARWESPGDIRQEEYPFPGCIRRVDWQFTTRGVAINLEVKYRAYDWLRWVDATRYARLLASYFDTVPAKFPCRVPGQVNLVAMTLLGALGPELTAKAQAFLDAHPALDGFLFWSIARRDLPGCECVLRHDAEFIRALLRVPEEENRWRNPFLVPVGFDWRRLTVRDDANRAALEGLFAAACAISPTGHAAAVASP